VGATFTLDQRTPSAFINFTGTLFLLFGSFFNVAYASTINNNTMIPGYYWLIKWKIIVLLHHWKKKLPMQV